MITRARRVIVRLSGSWPHLDHFLAGQPGREPPACPFPAVIDRLRGLDQMDTNNAGMTTRGWGRCAMPAQMRMMILEVADEGITSEGMNNLG